MTPPSPERFRRIDALFTQARELDPADRSAFLREACAGDGPLRDAVRALLRHDDQPHALLEHPLAPEGGTVCAVPTEVAAASVPQRIGPYRVRGILGIGGMGIVYEAEQSSPRRTVALKVMQRHASDAQVLRRFHKEAELLGALQHAGIAQIFEAGEADDDGVPRPYFAMEYVPGRPVTEYADFHGLGSRDRLRLLLDVCSAIAHAHDHGVIHRDLKPGNILVTDAGAVKVLDFGIARAIDADVQTTMRTDVRQLVGTLPYMSPEQLEEHASVGAAADVYALGVLCYELLAGRLPLNLRSKPLAEAARMIRDVDPTPLSAVNRLFRSDLETIVGKAVEKDPQRRYASVRELALDIDRYLRDEPIAARPASSFYQLRKFARRNRTLVASVAVIFAVLVIAVIVSLALLVQVRNHRSLAERQRIEAEWNAYTAGIAAAEAAVRSTNPAEARRRLELTPPALRDWEFDHLTSRTNRSKGELKGHADDRVLKKLRYSRDGQTLFSGGDDGTVRIWDVARGTSRALEGHTRWIHDFALSPDESRLATASQDTTVKVWDLATGSVLREFTDDHDQRVDTIAWSPDGRWLVSDSHDRRLVVRDLEAGGPNMVIEVAQNAGEHCLAFGPRGDYLFAGRADSTIEVRAVPSFQVARRLHCPAQVGQLAVDSLGDHLVAGLHNGMVQIWSLATFELVHAWSAHTGKIFAVDLDASGMRLLTASEDRSVRLWDPATGAALGVLVGHEHGVGAAAFRPDGKEIASGSHSRLLLWDAETDDVQTLDSDCTRFDRGRFSADGARVLGLGSRLAGGMQVLEWNLTGGPPRVLLSGAGYVLDALYVDDRSIAVAMLNGDLICINRDGQRRMLPRGDGWAWHAVSPDRRSIARVSDQRRQVEIIDAAT